VSHGSIGEVLRAQGKLDDALAAYHQTLAIAERLIADDPTNTVWQRDLALCHVRIGLIAERLGRNSEAVERYQEAAAISAELVARDSTNAVWQNEMIRDGWRIG
jgi:tetratricopeptide (TPR) repeat protein